jgi:hypothetical protein
MTKERGTLPWRAVAEMTACSLLCHPERTRISCHAAPDTVAYAPFSKERRMKFANATKFYRKSE